MEKLLAIRWTRLLLQSVFGLCVAAAVFVWFLSNWFGYNRPTQPVPADGRIYPCQDHYTIVYLTKTEHFVGCGAAWFILLGVAVLTGLIAQKMATAEKRMRQVR